jgi:hypothetical protein
MTDSAPVQKSEAEKPDILAQRSRLPLSMEECHSIELLLIYQWFYSLHVQGDRQTLFNGR